jgi:serine/threonine protein kinase
MAGLAQLAPGAVVGGDFRIVRPLGQGGMGAVYVAEQISTGKPRALKVMQPSLTSEPRFVEKFAQEARIGARIDSDHVVEVVGAGIDAGLGAPWLAMELLQGETLEQLVRRRTMIPTDEVVALFRQLCHALAAAHAAGIVHRDLKPENIFLATSRREGTASVLKILDFGIAKIVAEAHTQTTSAIGSPLWMAPEQSDPRGNIGPWTDVWPLGLIAFYLLTGRAYWRGAYDAHASVMSLMRETLFDPIEPASTRAAELGRPLPPAFDAWFARCVAREPHARFADAAQARAALEATLGFSPVSAPYSGGFAPPPTPGVPTPFGGTPSMPTPALPATNPSAVTGQSTTAPTALAPSHPGPEARASRDDDEIGDAKSPPGAGGRSPLLLMGVAVSVLLVGGGLFFGLRGGGEAPTSASAAGSAKASETAKSGPVGLVPVAKSSVAVPKASAASQLNKIRVKCDGAPAVMEAKAVVAVEILAEPSWAPDDLERVVRTAFGCKLAMTGRVVVPEYRLDDAALAAESKTRGAPAYVARLSIDDIHASGDGLEVTAHLTWLDADRKPQADVTKTVRFPGTYDRSHADEEQLLKQAFSALAEGVLVSLGVADSAPASPSAPSSPSARATASVAAPRR